VTATPRAMAMAQRSRAPSPLLAVGPTGLIGLHRWIGACFLFLSISRFHQYFQVLALLRIPTFLGLLCLGALIAATSQWHPADMKRSFIMKGMGVVLLCSIASIAFGIYPGRSLSYLQEVVFPTAVSTLLAFALARSREGMKFLGKVVAVSCVTASGMAVLIGRTDYSARLSGAYSYDPNDLALVSDLALPLVIWWGASGEKYGKVMLLSVPVLLSAIIRSESRGGLLGLGAMMMVIILLGTFRTNPKISRVGRILTLLILLAIPAAPDVVTERLSSINDENDYNRTAYAGREQLWTRGLIYIEMYPLFGIGLENYRTAEGLNLAGRAIPGKGIKWSAPHNSFLQVAAETGIISGLAFIWIVFGGIVKLLKLARKPGMEDLFPPLLGTCLTGFATSGFFLSWGFADLTYILLSLSAACLLYHQDEPVPAPRGARPFRRPGVTRAPVRTGPKPSPIPGRTPVYLPPPLDPPIGDAGAGPVLLPPA
jgi:O-antigen ligase